MVYVPILKIDLPEPSLQELIPGVVHAVLSTCTRVFDVVYDYLNPLTPEQKVILYTATISHLPKEFRKARKRIVEKNIQDEDKMSEELEDAAYAYYRRRMREEMAGYSDEETEDVTFRRLMTARSATRELHGPGPMEYQDVDAEAGPPVAQATTAAAAAVVHLPSRGRRITVTTAAGASGLALGAGCIKLAQLISRLRGKKKKPKGRRSGAAQQQQGAGAAGQRRRPEAGSSSGRAGGTRGSRGAARANRR